MEQAGVREPRFLQVIRVQADTRPALRRHRPMAVGSDQHRDGAGRLRGPHRAHLDPSRLDVGHQPPAGLVIADARDEACRFAQRGGPGAEVGGLAASADRDRGRGIVIRLERSLGHDPDVEHQVADGDDHDLTRIAAAQSTQQLRYLN